MNPFRARKRNRANSRFIDEKYARGGAIASAKNQGLPITDRDSARSGPVRVIMANGVKLQPIPPQNPTEVKS